MATKKEVSTIQQLQNKIHELEILINSIRNGEVDSLVGVDSQGNKSIFTIEGSDQPYRLLIESSSAGILTLNEAGNIVHCNSAFSKMINVPLRTIIGSPMTDYIPENQHGFLKNFISQSKLKDIQCEFTIVGDKTFMFSSHNIKLGSINGISMIATDISDIKREQHERLKLKDELIQREHLFRDIAENIDEVFWCMTPEMDRLIYVSPAYEKIWGHSVEILYNDTFKWMEFIVEEDKDNAKLFLQKLLTEDYVTTEYTIVLNDGITKFIAVKGFQNKDEQGKVINVIGIASDITKLKKMESEAHLNDKLRTIGTLAASVAHEINNPIAWILGNLEYVKRKAGKLDQLQLEELMNESIEGAKQISDIVLSLKGFTRFNEQSLTLIDLNQVIDSVLKIAFSEIKIRATLETKYIKNLPLVKANNGKLHQVFLNLIMNAAQAIPQGNTKKNKISISTKQEDKYIKVDIRDTGCGIDHDKISKIFEPFFTTKSKGLGTGLGLSISHEIIKSFGGEITVKSLPGKGATFSVYLPVASKMQVLKEQAIKKTEVISTVRKRILLTDDEPLLLKSIQRMLQDEYDIITASSGEAAISFLHETRQMFDVLIFDFNMPGISGMELYQFVAKHFPGLENRIIFLTGNVFFHDQNAILNNIKNICLNKPFEQEELINAIEKIGVSASDSALKR